MFFGVLIVSRGGYYTPLKVESLIVGVLISIGAFIAIFHTCTAEADAAKLKDMHIKRSHMMAEFNKADTSKNGSLSSNEFLRFLRSIDLSLSLDDLDTILLEVDESHDEEVSFDEFLKWYDKRDEDSHV